jgi:hypothetical protein
MLLKSHEGADVLAAVRQALDAQVSCSDAVEHILINMAGAVETQPVVSLSNWPIFPPADVSVYDKIGGVI